ncbi:hypothetical protein AOLI_G00141700 [Acnodon oligacanthus]
MAAQLVVLLLAAGLWAPRSELWPYLCVQSSPHPPDKARCCLTRPPSQDDLAAMAISGRAFLLCSVFPSLGSVLCGTSARPVCQRCLRRVGAGEEAEGASEELHICPDGGVVGRGGPQGDTDVKGLGAAGLDAAGQTCDLRHQHLVALQAGGLTEAVN